MEMFFVNDPEWQRYRAFFGSPMVELTTKTRSGFSGVLAKTSCHT